MKKKQMMRRYLFLTGTGLMSLFFLSCGGSTSPEGEEETGPAASSEVVLSREQFDSGGMTLARIDTAEFYVMVHANGYVRVVPGHRAAISPYSGGFVREVRALPGDRVRKGEVLVTLVNPAYITLQQDYLEAKARLEYLEQEFRRQEELSKENIASRKQLQKVRSDHTTALARYNALREQLRLLGLSPERAEQGRFTSVVALTSPISGVVEKVNAVVGDYVSSEDVVARIIDPDAVHLELNIFENDVLKVRNGQEVIFHRPGVDLRKCRATIYRLTRSIDAADRTVKAYARLQEPALPVMDGMYVEADILTGRAVSPYLPAKAVVEEGERKVVLVLYSENDSSYVFRKVTVKTGRMENGRIEIMDPSEIGNRQVLAEGAFFLL